MPARISKTAKKEMPVESKLPRPPKVTLPKIKDFLAAIYFLIWIPIGLFVLLFIIMSVRQGAFNSLFGKQSAAPTTSNQTPTQQTETKIPGVGTVNIACVQSNLSQEEIQKIITVGDTSTFTPEEKTKLEPCITKKETPAATPDTTNTTKK